QPTLFALSQNQPAQGSPATCYATAPAAPHSVCTSAFSPRKRLVNVLSPACPLPQSDFSFSFSVIGSFTPTQYSHAHSITPPTPAEGGIPTVSTHSLRAT